MYDDIPWLTINGDDRPARFISGLIDRFKSFLISSPDATSLAEATRAIVAPLVNRLHVVLIEIEGSGAATAVPGVTHRLAPDASGIFSAARSALRMDPDVIAVVGASPEHAELLFTAAETGHLVIASFAPGADPAEVLQANLPPALHDLIPFHTTIELGAGPSLARILDTKSGRELLNVSPSLTCADDLLELVAPPPPPPPEPPSCRDVESWEPLPKPLPEMLAEANAGLERPAWRPILAGPDSEGGPAAGSKLGGRPLLLSAEAWPKAPATGREMVFVLQLDTASLPASAQEALGWRAGHLQLFYDPGPGDGEPWQPFSGFALARYLAPDAELRPAAELPRLEHAEPEWRAYEITGWRESQETPHSEDRAALDRPLPEAIRDAEIYLTAEQRRILGEGGALAEEFAAALKPELDYWGISLSEALEMGDWFAPFNGDKLLGWPSWAQGPERPRCPESGELMEPIFQLSADGPGWPGAGAFPRLFAADGTGHIFRSPKHPHILAFGWAC